MIIKSTSLEDFFIEKVKNIPSREDTKAYIVSTFAKYKISDNDLSDKILILEYIKAKENHSFKSYQDIADWILFIKSVYPDSLPNASDNYYFSLAQTCYYKCYLMINKTWLLFEELADNFPIFIKYLHEEIQNSPADIPLIHI